MSDERIASASVTKKKRKRKQVSAYLGAQQPQAHGDAGIITGRTRVGIRDFQLLYKCSVGWSGMICRFDMVG